MTNTRIRRLALALSVFVVSAYALPDPASSTSSFLSEHAANFTPSLDVSDCPGYELTSVKHTNTGLSASLRLAGTACNAFGQDISDLTVQVSYESNSRLHVNIFDMANQQYTIPDSVVQLPVPPTESFKGTSDLVFNYDSSPFAFWITRRSLPDAAPLFDTRIESLPKAPIPPVISGDNSTALNGFPLVFEDQYLQIASVLPLDTNIYGLGESVASSGFRRDVDSTIKTMWARDAPDPVDQNMYGSHPIYVEHRFDQSTNTAQSHGVFLFSAAPSDILLLTPPNTNKSLIEYRMVGGVLDFYFFSGPTPVSVIEQYGQLIGLPTWQPAWGFGFHLCRWGYHNISQTREQVTNMRAANIPLEVIWNDINLYHALRDFTSDPVSFPGDEMRAFIQELNANNQHYIPIVDAAIAKQVNATDIYNPYIKGAEQKTFVTNLDGSEYIGQVWPGYTVFPDWFSENTQSWWTEALKNWSASGVEFSGLWLDMNEISSFCTGSCGTGANLSDISSTTEPNSVPGYPECYNETLWGPSGNITVNGTLTCNLDTLQQSTVTRRGLGAGSEPNVDLLNPPYAIHNGNGALSANTLQTNATHSGGQVELDVHNMWGMMEEKTTHLAVQDVIPGKRPFIIARSTFPSSGRWSGHWLGDNFSLWSYLRYSIQGILQFQIFQIPMVGADTCGFNQNTDEELCNRWMQLAAFSPFYRNHNTQGALSQEPYRWDSVAEASRTAIAVRYAILPYWYTLFANSSMFGTPPVRALFYEFPTEQELFNVSAQFLVGGDILVTPVLEPNVSIVSGIFPGRGSVIWRDWYTHEVVNASAGATTTLAAPLGHINVHIRDSSAILLHAAPAYTIEETRQGPYSLLVSQSADGLAHGSTYIDDGISDPPGPSRILTFSATKNQVLIASQGTFHIMSKLQDVSVLGVGSKPAMLLLNGEKVANWTYAAEREELVVGLNADLNAPLVLNWE